MDLAEAARTLTEAATLAPSWAFGTKEQEALSELLDIAWKYDKGVKHITGQIAACETASRRLYLWDIEEDPDALDADEVNRLFEALTDEQKDAAPGEWSEETFTESETLEALKAGLENALQAMHGKTKAVA